MSIFRWWCAALVTLAAAGAASAQSASFSVLRVSALFSYEPENTPSVLPWVPNAGGNVFGFMFNYPPGEESEEPEILPAPQRCDEKFVLARCLECWKDQWHNQNYVAA